MLFITLRGDHKRRSRPEDCPVETDARKLNEFCHAYNRYVTNLNQGIVDLHSWKMLVRRAKDLFGKCFECLG